MKEMDLKKMAKGKQSKADPSMLMSLCKVRSHYLRQGRLEMERTIEEKEEDILSVLRLVEREVREECAEVADEEAEDWHHNAAHGLPEEIDLFHFASGACKATAQKIRALAEQGPPQEEEESRWKCQACGKTWGQTHLWRPIHARKAICPDSTCQGILDQVTEEEVKP